MKRGGAAVLGFAFLIAASCGGTTATGGAAASGAPNAGGPSFIEILSSSRASEYKVTYRLTATGGAAGFSGEQSWFFKPPKARFDFSSSASGQTATVSLFALPDGTFMCFGGTGQTAQCIGMTGLDTALQQNPAALFQESMLQHPERFSGVLVETRQVAGQQAHCYDVKPVTATIAGLTDGRFCYSPQGIPLLQRFTAQGGTWSMEATTLSTAVPDADFTLPSKPTILGRP
ncbi:MAG: hypothetical protein WEE03_07935 [Chloroflexota bacterium]